MEPMGLLHRFAYTSPDGRTNSFPKSKIFGNYIQSYTEWLLELTARRYEQIF